MQFKQQIEEVKKKTNQIRNSQAYELLNLNKEKHAVRIKSLLESTSQIIDEIDVLLDELYEIRFPGDHEKDPSNIENFKREVAPLNLNCWGIWVYYSWSDKLVHFPPEEIWEEIRTARNKTLITKEEQDKFWEFNIGIAGLSIGQSAALAIVRGGGCKNIKLADPDILNPTNLNRLDGNLSNCGTNKTTLVSQKILELDPYYNLKLYRRGIDKDNLEDFFNKDFKLNAIIDAMDNIPLKIELRLFAKKYRVPVLMATDAADGVILDIERYDLEGNKAIFGGRIEENIEIKNKDDFIRAGLRIISPEYITLPMNRAMMDIGKKIPTHPQLGSSAILSGATMTYAIRKLSLGINFSSERTHIDFEQFLNPEVKTVEYKKQHLLATKQLQEFLNINP